ncbi:hypothetical protein AAG906_038069 [Vitis piasezkii]
MASASQPNAGSQGCWWWLLKDLPEKTKNKVVNVAGKANKLGRDEPRRIIHCLKVGLALTVVSLLYYVHPLYKFFHESGVWAVLTVLLVLEFTVGGTLGRGLNRTFATLLGGALGVGAQHLAALSGEIGQPIVLGLCVMVLTAAVTFLRFFPEVKARYDYGLIILMLTFSMVSVSGYRDEDVLTIAYERLLTIIVGCVIALLVSILICPVWVGEDLQRLIAANLEKLGSFLEGFSGAYCRISGDAQITIDQSFLQGYKSVLTSKHTEETMVNLARWEPGHGRFLFRHPWKQYLKVGTLARQCSYKIEILSGHLASEIEAAQEIRGEIQESCREMTRESGKALKELAATIRTMTRSTSMDFHIENSKGAAKNLMSLLETGVLEDGTTLLEIIPAVAVASTVMDIVTCTERISDAVKELASLAHFKSTISPVVTPEEP